jgi:hypothetical protein
MQQIEKHGFVRGCDEHGWPRDRAHPFYQPRPASKAVLPGREKHSFSEVLEERETKT